MFPHKFWSLYVSFYVLFLPVFRPHVFSSKRIVFSAIKYVCNMQSAPRSSLQTSKYRFSCPGVLILCCGYVEVLEMENGVLEERCNECNKFLQRTGKHYKTTRLHKTVETLSLVVILVNDAVKGSDCTA